MQDPRYGPPEYGSQPPDGYPSPPGPGQQADIPVDSQHHYNAAPARGRNGIVGYITGALLAIWGVAKYALLAFKAIPFLATGGTLLLSFGLYALWQGPWFAAGLVLMILVHEMGHVIEIRRQGMTATAPIFIPFMGAAIFQRSHPTDALSQAKIGIAGPLLGTVGAVVAYALYGATGFVPLLLAAYLGFWINLFNLIPAGMFDGGWILAPVSKWFQLVGLTLLGALIFFAGLNPIILVFIIFSIPTIISRFRHADSPYFTSVPVRARWGMGAAWLVLAIFLGFATLQSDGQLQTALHGF